MDQLRIELERIERALGDPQTDERYCQLYAAQQALAWALDPSTMMSPYEAIQRGRVIPPNGIREDSKDCPADPRRSRFSGTYCQNG
jgi:hypothetical protein